jgi:hypothetical protein
MTLMIKPEIADRLHRQASRLMSMQVYIASSEGLTHPMKMIQYSGTA